MRLTVSSSRFLKVMDKYAVKFDEMLAEQKLKSAEMMAKQHNPSQAAFPLTSIPGGVNTVPFLSNVLQVNCMADLRSSPTWTEKSSQDHFLQKRDIYIGFCLSSQYRSTGGSEFSTYRCSSYRPFKWLQCCGGQLGFKTRCTSHDI